jgi:hypothetical protein
MCSMSGEITTTYKSGIGILTGICHFIHLCADGKITLKWNSPIYNIWCGLHSFTVGLITVLSIAHAWILIPAS